jgi:hypothetical protein
MYERHQRVWGYRIKVHGIEFGLLGFGIWGLNKLIKLYVPHSSSLGERFNSQALGFMGKCLGFRVGVGD